MAKNYAQNKNIKQDVQCVKQHDKRVRRNDKHYGRKQSIKCKQLQKQSISESI